MLCTYGSIELQDAPWNAYFWLAEKPELISANLILLKQWVTDIPRCTLVDLWEVLPYRVEKKCQHYNTPQAGKW